MPALLKTGDLGVGQEKRQALNEGGTLTFSQQRVLFFLSFSKTFHNYEGIVATQEGLHSSLNYVVIGERAKCIATRSPDSVVCTGKH